MCAPRSPPLPIPLPERFLRILLRFQHVKLDGVADEFKAFLHQIFQELELGLVRATNDLRVSLDHSLYHHGVSLLGERTTSRRLPDVLFIVIVLGEVTSLIQNQTYHMETDAELFNHAKVAAFTHNLHTNFGDLLVIARELVFYHTNARIVDRDGRVGLVRNGRNEEIWLGLNISGSVTEWSGHPTPESRVCQRVGGDARCTHHGREIQLELHVKNC